MFFHYLFWGCWLLPSLHFSLDGFLSIWLLKVSNGIFILHMLNDTLLGSLHVIIIFVVNRDNWVDSFVSVIVFIKLIKIPILSSLPLRIMNSRLSRTPLMPIALLNLFHVLHNLPNIVFVFLLYIEVSSVVVIQIVSQILKLLRRLLLIYLR